MFKKYRYAQFLCTKSTNKFKELMHGCSKVLSSPKLVSYVDILNKRNIETIFLSITEGAAATTIGNSFKCSL